jgi:hypothetical protein
VGQCLDDRMAMIAQAGVMANKGLAEKFGISGAGLSQWLKLKVDQDKLAWCNARGEAFEDINALTRAKHMGNAYVRCTHMLRLPSPYDLTGDLRWEKKGGENYSRYDLHLDAIEAVGSSKPQALYHSNAVAIKPDVLSIH